MLHTPREFAAVAAARGPRAPRAARRFLAMSSLISESIDDGAARVRCGLTIPRRLARRAVDRNLVKRVAREALRAALPALAEAVTPLRVDLVLRLKAPLPPVVALARRQLRRQLRDEADALLAGLVRDARAC